MSASTINGCAVQKRTGPARTLWHNDSGATVPHRAEAFDGLAPTGRHDDMEAAIRIAEQVMTEGDEASCLPGLTSVNCCSSYVEFGLDTSQIVKGKVQL